MTDEISRREFEALKQRVDELESKLNTGGSNSRSTSSGDIPVGLDRRDMAVLNLLESSGVRSGYRLVKAYQSTTDITNKATAKQRAKMLEQRPEYKALL